MKRIIKGFFLVFILFIGLNVDAATKKEAQQAIVNSAYAYYYRGNAVQYDSKGMNFQSKTKKKQRNVGTYDNKISKYTFFTPEQATTQDNHYTVCSSFVLNAIYESFINVKDKLGYTLKDKNNNYLFVTLKMITIGDKNSDGYNKKIVAYYNDNLATLKKNKDVEGMKKVYKDFINTLEPGDIIVRTTKTGGHAVLYVGNNFTLESGGEGANKESDDDSNWAKYDFLKKTDNVESKGTVKLRKLKKYDNWKDFSYTKREDGYNGPREFIGGSVQKIIIIRVANDIANNSNWDLSSNAKNRKNYTRLSMTKTSSKEKYASVDYNDSITYTITLTNHSSKDYKNVPVKDSIPDGTTLESMTTSYNGKLSGNNLTWKVDVPSKKSVTISFKVKVKNNIKYGSFITSNKTTVNGIKLNTIKTLVTKSLSKDTKEKINNIKNGNSYKNSKELLSYLYKDYKFYDTKELINKLFIIKSLDNKWSNKYAVAKGKSKVNTYQLRNSVNNEDKYLMNMYVDGLFGGVFTYKEQNPTLYDNRIMTITNNSFSVGDILLVVDGSYKNDSSLGITSEYSTFVYIGNSKFITVSNNKLKVLPASTGKKLIESLLGQDLFIVLRPMKDNKKVESPIIEVKSISLNKTNIELKIGESDTLVATITPSNATDKNITWESSNNEIVVVSDGLVVGNNESEATVTVKSSNGKKATCTVKVTKKDTGKIGDDDVKKDEFLNNKILMIILIVLIILLIVSIIIHKRKDKNIILDDDLESDEDDDSVNDDNYF